MKKLVSLITIVFFAAAVFTSCSKEGPEGLAGLAGKDANETCKKCHNLANMDAVSENFSKSLHQAGTSWADETNRNSCGPCHAADGFMEAAKSNWDVNMAGIPYESKLTCQNCHSFHNTLDSAEFPDYALRPFRGFSLRINKTATYAAVAPSTTLTYNVSYLGGTAAIAMDLGKSNVCARCHQARTVSPYPDETLTTNLTTTSFRWGTHYGTQANIFGGKGAFEFTGTATYSNSKHTTVTSCGECHITTAKKGGKVGGHTFKMAEGTELNVEGCLACHPGATNFDILGKQAEIKALLNTLGNKLDVYLDKDAAHPMIPGMAKAWSGYIDIYDATNNPDGVYKSTNPFTVSQTVAKAIINFQIILRDRSLGVHNYAYTKALLTNTIAKLP